MISSAHLDQEIRIVTRRQNHVDLQLRSIWFDSVVYAHVRVDVFFKIQFQWSQRRQIFRLLFFLYFVRMMHWLNSDKMCLHLTEYTHQGEKKHQWSLQIFVTFKNKQTSWKSPLIPWNDSYPTKAYLCSTIEIRSGTVFIKYFGIVWVFRVIFWYSVFLPKFI